MDHKENNLLSQENILQRLRELERENHDLRTRLQAQIARSDAAAEAASVEYSQEMTAANLRLGELQHNRRSLQASEGWLRALLESATDYAIITLDLTGRITSWNSGAHNILGWEEDEITGQYTDLFFTPEDREANQPEVEMQKALAEGRAQDERWHIRKDGSRFWGHGVLMPFQDSELLGFLKILRDRTQEKHSDQRLRANEEHLREILESISDAFYAIDHEWRFTYVNRKAEELWGRRREDLIGKVYPETFPQIVGSESFKTHVQAMTERQPVHFEAISPILQYWIDINIYPTADGGLSIYFRDITERKRAEEHQRVLIHELNHRVKNTLATVQSIASQTLRNTDTAQEAQQALESRLFALSRAHDVLTRENWEAASLHEIVAEAIAPYRNRKESRIEFAGPTVRIPPRMALALAMAFQELATNAVKYGALSNENGHVGIRWTIGTKDMPPCLRLRWEEIGGPPVRAPERRGFGTRLIERSLAHDLDGKATITFAPTGVLCEVEAPLQ